MLFFSWCRVKTLHQSNEFWDQLQHYCLLNNFPIDYMQPYVLYCLYIKTSCCKITLQCDNTKDIGLFLTCMAKMATSRVVPNYREINSLQEMYNVTVPSKANKFDSLSRHLCQNSYVLCLFFNFNFYKNELCPMRYYLYMFFKSFSVWN